MRLRSRSLLALLLGVSLLVMLGGAVAQTAPAATPAAEPIPGPAAQNTGGYVSYNPNIASEIATRFTVDERYNNLNGCYLSRVGGLCLLINYAAPEPTQPNPPGGPDTANGANFLACVLSAAGIETISCVPSASRLSGPAPGHVVLNIDQILPNPNNLPPGWSRVAMDGNLEVLQEGDIAFVMGMDGTACWAGVVREVTPSPQLELDNEQLRIATHSFSDANRDLDFDGSWCGGYTAQNPSPIRYVRINGDYTPPALSPAPLTVDYTSMIPLSWPAATDFGPDGVTVQSDVRDYRLEDTSGLDLTAPSASPQASVGLPMCSENELRIVVADNVGNEGSYSLFVRVRQQGDLVPDGIIDAADLARFNEWLTNPNPPLAADMNGDGSVTADDELWLFLRLGETCQYF